MYMISKTNGLKLQ